MKIDRNQFYFSPQLSQKFVTSEKKEKYKKIEHFFDNFFDTMAPRQPEVNSIVRTTRRPSGYNITWENRRVSQTTPASWFIRGYMRSRSRRNEGGRGRNYAFTPSRTSQYSWRPYQSLYIYFFSVFLVNFWFVMLCTVCLRRLRYKPGETEDAAG